MKIEKLQGFISDQDNYESLFTVLIHHTSKKHLVKDIQERLMKIKGISKKYKRIKLNNRLYGFLNYINELDKLDDSDTTELNAIFLVGSEIQHLPLNKKQQQLLKEYNVKPYQFWNDTYYNISYLVDVFTNHEFVQVISIQKHTLLHRELNLYKHKQIKETNFPKDSFSEKVDNYLQQLNKEVVLMGDIQTLKHKLKYTKILYHSLKILSPKQLCQVYEIGKVKKYTPKLQELFQKLENPHELHLVIYGSLEGDIKESIEGYRVKRLFLHQKVETKFTQLIEPSYLNFDICKMRTLESGDISDKLLHDYGGVIAEAYY